MQALSNEKKKKKHLKSIPTNSLPTSGIKLAEQNGNDLQAP